MSAIKRVDSTMYKNYYEDYLYHYHFKLPYLVLMHWYASTNLGHGFASRVANRPRNDLAVFRRKAFSRVFVRPPESNSTTSR